MRPSDGSDSFFFFFQNPIGFFGFAKEHDVTAIQAHPGIHRNVSGLKDRKFGIFQALIDQAGGLQMARFQILAATGGAAECGHVESGNIATLGVAIGIGSLRQVYG